MEDLTQLSSNDRSPPKAARQRLSFDLSEEREREVCRAGNAHRPFRSELSLDKIRNHAIKLSFAELNAVCRTRARSNETGNAL